jgi:hypothetical protein
MPPRIHLPFRRAAKNQIDKPDSSPICDLPNEILCTILGFLDFNELVTTLVVCRNWNYAITHNSALWKPGLDFNRGITVAAAKRYLSYALRGDNKINKVSLIGVDPNVAVQVLDVALSQDLGTLIMLPDGEISSGTFDSVACSLNAQVRLRLCVQGASIPKHKFLDLVKPVLKHGDIANFKWETPSSLIVSLWLVHGWRNSTLKRNVLEAVSQLPHDIKVDAFQWKPSINHVNLRKLHIRDRSMSQKRVLDVLLRMPRLQVLVIESIGVEHDCVQDAVLPESRYLLCLIIHRPDALIQSRHLAQTIIKSSPNLERLSLVTDRFRASEMLPFPNKIQELRLTGLVDLVLDRELPHLRSLSLDYGLLGNGVHDYADWGPFPGLKELSLSGFDLPNPRPFFRIVGKGLEVLEMNHGRLSSLELIEICCGFPNLRVVSARGIKFDHHKLENLATEGMTFNLDELVVSTSKIGSKGSQVLYSMGVQKISTMDTKCEQSDWICYQCVKNSRVRWKRNSTVL